MPHFTMEYSSNLDGVVDFPGLCRAVHATIMESGHFELGAIRVRAIRCEAYAVADLLLENGFIDMSFRIGKGRGDEEKRRTGEDREIDPDLSWKKNAIHPRLRQKA
jgi:5-carboxymethyl-2-hydroxymuconate isomerase